MYMNAITVNYAEVGDDHLPILFGFVRNSDLTAQTIIYNSKKININDTYSVLTCGELNSINIIVSSDSETSRSLTQFSQGPSSWIEHKLPIGSATSDFYIKYENGHYYKMVEDENGKSGWEKYAPYARLINVKDNTNSQPYCEATIKTPVSLEISGGRVNAIINGRSVQIAEMGSSLTVKLENADGTYTQPTINNEYLIDTSTYNLDDIKWTRDSQEVTPWLSGTKIVKSSISTNGWTKTIKLLAGNNVVTIPRNKSTIRVNFTFTNTNMPSFEWGSAYYNGSESSNMPDNNTLTISNVRQGSSINLTTFYTDSIANWFNPSSIGSLPGPGTFNVQVSIPTPSATDTIKFTGWIDGKLEQDYIIKRPHDILPKTYTIDNMNTESLSNVDIKIDDKATSLLSYINNSTQFKHHRQITHIQQSSTGLTLSSTTTIDDTKAPSTSSNSSGGKDIYIYAKDNNENKIFNVTAHYTSIPAVVSVTAPNNPAAASNNQVVLFEDAYYVANDNMKDLVESLVSGVTVTAQKEIVRNVAWQTTTLQTYYKMNTTTTENETNTTYTPKFAEITISGISSQVTSVESSDPNLTVSNYSLSIDGTILKITITYTVSAGFSLSEDQTITTLNNTVSIPENDWNQKITYKFFN